jgi:hypothetical protein
VEEEMHDGLIVFAPTSQLTAVALELLQSPQARWDLERNARRFMTADQFSTTVPQFNGSLASRQFSQSGAASRLSSLSLVAKALQSVAGAVYVISANNHLLFDTD